MSKMMPTQLRPSVLRRIIFVRLAILLRPRGKFSFLSKLSANARILDVGCGNNSSFYSKLIHPEFHYTGIDIDDYNQQLPEVADEYIITSPGKFSNSINELGSQFDATISAHNLEHCDDREGTLKAILNSVKTGGKLYISFPSAASIFFPARRGTLNYYDDSTHKFTPPEFSAIRTYIENNDFHVIYSTERYRPFLLRIIGLLMEPFSYMTGNVQRGTWELYGFESIIWAEKLDREHPAIH